MSEQEKIVLERPTGVQGVAEVIEKFRLELLFNCDDFPTMDSIAEQEYLTAIGYLELAHRAAARAGLHQTRALAVSPYR